MHETKAKQSKDERKLQVSNLDQEMPTKNWWFDSERHGRCIKLWIYNSKTLENLWS